MIKVVDLKVHYGNTVALDLLSFSVKPGSIYDSLAQMVQGKPVQSKPLPL